MKRATLRQAALMAVLGLPLTGTATLAQALPQYVKGPLSGFAYDCAQEKQPFDAKGFVTSVDLDGDGKADHVFDIAKGCAANRLLYCNADGCNVDVYLSRSELKEAGHKARGFRISTRQGRPALVLTMSGTACGAAPALCQKTLVWTGQGLALE